MPHKILPQVRKFTVQPLDRLDIRILAALQENARVTNRELADKVGLSPSPCLVRVKRLESAGFINRYMAMISLKKLVESIRVFSLVYLHESNYKAAHALEGYLLQLPQLCDLYDVNGECDYIASFICRSVEDYAGIAHELLESPQYQVRQISSHIVLRHVKEFSGFNLPFLLTRTSE
jgi:DNA-binding Lrp family transcriptional regulator